MDFKVNAKYEENLVSKKGNIYNRVVLDFGKFKEYIFLDSLKSEVLKNMLTDLSKKDNA